SQRYVLSGYSQGALAIHLYLRTRATEAERALISSVVLVADPARVDFGDELLYEDGMNSAGVGVQLSKGVYALFGAMPGAGSLPTDIVGRTLSLCYKKDIVCAPGSGWGASATVHGSYDQHASDLAELGDLSATDAAHDIPSQP
ncbi:MAG TPA: cutinase family protein, partial [Propionicimonas sp.]